MCAYNQSIMRMKRYVCVTTILEKAWIEHWDVGWNVCGVAHAFVNPWPNIRQNSEKQTTTFLFD